MMADTEGKKNGYDKCTAQIDKLTFETYNKKFANTTKADWLCSNPNIVKAYLTDESCGKGFTAGLFHDLLDGMEYTCNKTNMKKMNPKCPILMLSGANDPVGDFGKGVKKLQKMYKSLGIPVSCQIFNGARHDILNDRGNQRVYLEIAKFIME